MGSTLCFIFLFLVFVFFKNVANFFALLGVVGRSRSSRKVSQTLRGGFGQRFGLHQRVSGRFRALGAILFALLRAVAVSQTLWGRSMRRS